MVNETVVRFAIEIILIWSLSCAANKGRDAMGQCVGFRTGLLLDEARSNWAGEGPRPLRWAAWYPAERDSANMEITIPRGGLSIPWAAGAEGTSVCGYRPLPGGADLAWHGGSLQVLAGASSLAEQGYVVLGVDHHGNTASKPIGRKLSLLVGKGAGSHRSAGPVERRRGVCRTAGTH